MLFLKPTTSEASDPLCFLPATPKSFAECESRLDFVMEELDFVWKRRYGSDCFIHPYLNPAPDLRRLSMQTRTLLLIIATTFLAL